LEALVLEAEMVEIVGMTGGRLEKTNVFDIWFAFKPPVGIDRRLDVY
jgi:hypothetical protein